MARHIWTVLCTKASIDSQDQSLSIHQVLEEVQATITLAPGQEPPGKLAVGVPVTVLSLWERSNLAVPEVKETVQLRIIDPDGKELARSDQVISMAGAHIRFRAIVNVNPLVAHREGRYEFHVFASRGRRWAKVASVPLVVKISLTEARKEGARPS